MSRYVPKRLISLFIEVWNRDNDGWREVTEHRINHGWCYQFAVLLKRLHGEKVALYHDTGHAWIKIGDKFYDSDTPDGCKETKGLSGPPHLYGLKECVSEGEMIDFWKNGGSGPVQLNIIDEVLRRYMESE